MKPKCNVCFDRGIVLVWSRNQAAITCRCPEGCEKSET